MNHFDTHLMLEYHRQRLHEAMNETRHKAMARFEAMPHANSRSQPILKRLTAWVASLRKPIRRPHAAKPAEITPGALHK